MKLTGIVIMSLGMNLLASIAAFAQDEPQLQQYMRGSKIWQQNCARCHNLRRPENYSDEQWELITHHMRLRAGLTGQETTTLAQFLKAIN
jgi:hypothetical protein